MATGMLQIKSANFFKSNMYLIDLQEIEHFPGQEIVLVIKNDTSQH
jgi:hypothetical protein